MSQTIRIIYAAALPYEIKGLVRGWELGRLAGLPLWRKADVAVTCLGMGYDKAYNGAKVLIESLHPEVIASIGFVGAARPSLYVGAVMRPKQVLHLTSGARYASGGEDGLLVTIDQVASSKMKAKLARRVKAAAVEMEAAGVACAAQECGVAFRAIRSVSDGVSDRMDFTLPFMREDGFATGSFLAHVAIRPWLWGALGRLASASSLAAHSLQSAVESDMTRQGN